MISFFSIFFANNAFAGMEDISSFFQENQLVANLVPFLVIIAVFYFFMIKPQQKKYKEFQDMLSSIKAGDKISTTGGLIGSIVEINDEKGYVVLSLNKGVEVMIFKKAISEVLKNDTSEIVKQ